MWVERFFRWGMYALFLCAFALVSLRLFFPAVWGEIVVFVQHEEVVIVETPSVVKFIFPEEPVSLDPTSSDIPTRQRLINIYQPLIEFDRDLNLRPALAVNWGLIDELTWEFDLRPGVTFHDGSIFDADDVIYSLASVRKNDTSSLKGLVETVSSVEKISDSRLLLQKLSQVFMIADGSDLKSLSVTPVGTGPYRFKSWAKGEKFIVEGFAEYWGRKSSYQQVEVFAITNKFERVELFLSGGANFLSFVPYDSVAAVQSRGFEVVAVPSLEVQFLLFNFLNNTSLDKVKRQVISLVVDQEELVTRVGGYARAVTQYVSSGVFGFNPQIKKHEYDLEKAFDLVQEFDLAGETFRFALPQGLTLLGDYVSEQLVKVGINVEVLYLDGNAFFDSLKKGSADFYFLGFRSDLGDAGNFLMSLPFSKGEFNFTKYSHETVDDLITQSLVEFDVRDRLSQLQQAMRVIVEDDYWGVPLFEYETLYSFSSNFEFMPRIDGQVFFDDLIFKGQ